MACFEFFCYDNKGGCGYEFEEYLSIEDRGRPMDEPCPKCGKLDTVCRKFSVHLHKGVVNPMKKMDSNFKETMTRIHSENPDAQSSYF